MTTREEIVASNNVIYNKSHYTDNAHHTQNTANNKGHTTTVNIKYSKAIPVTGCGGL
jgi:hypothetical protein